MGLIKFNKDEVIKLVSSLPPTSKVMLVGDEGVYLMSFDQVLPRTIVYAKGCNPKVDEDYYENKHDLFGGDDGGDEIGTAGGLLRIASVCSRWVEVRLSATTITIRSDVAVPKVMPKVDASLLPLALRKYVK